MSRSTSCERSSTCEVLAANERAARTQQIRELGTAHFGEVGWHPYQTCSDQMKAERGGPDAPREGYIGRLLLVFSPGDEALATPELAALGRKRPVVTV